MRCIHCNEKLAAMRKLVSGIIEAVDPPPNCYICCSVCVKWNKVVGSRPRKMSRKELFDFYMEHSDAKYTEEEILENKGVVT